MAVKGWTGIVNVAFMQGDEKTTPGRRFDMETLTTILRNAVTEMINLIPPLAFVLVLAVAFVWVSRGSRKPRLRSIVRAIMTRRIWLSRSALMDYQYVALNMMVFPVMLSGVIFGTGELSAALAANLPKPDGPGLFSPAVAHVILMVVLFLALEFAYWFDHYLSHKVPMLWEFHKVHHTAEVLTPFTNFRVHPFDSMFYYNIKAITVAFVYVAMIYILGTGPVALPESGFVVVYMWLYGHLQHSEIWIPFTGLWGKFFFSPAHHQIHHSKARIHHNTNFGMSLSIFDWMFGTLRVPTKEKQNLKFGVSNDTHHHHVLDSLVDPVVRAAKRFLPKKAPKPVIAPGE